MLGQRRSPLVAGASRRPHIGVTPADNEEWATAARTGGTVRGQEVWDLDPKLVKRGLLTVETYDADFNTVFADFAI